MPGPQSLDGPSWIVEHGVADCNQVGLAVSEVCLGLRSGQDHADTSD
jgi:hypothetical protein